MVGDDGILVKGGDDLINFGVGDDLVGVGFGDDIVIVVVGDGDDEIYLGVGDDFYGGLDLGVDEGNDMIFGGSGEDIIIINLGNYYIEVGDGDDWIEDYGGIVYIDGGDDDDLILLLDVLIFDVQDMLMGGSGDDIIYVGVYDFVDVGDGVDLIVLCSDVGGLIDIVYDVLDWLNIMLVDGYDGFEEVDLVQDQGDVYVVLNGQVMVILCDIEVVGVGLINVICEVMGC